MAERAVKSITARGAIVFALLAALFASSCTTSVETPALAPTSTPKTPYRVIKPDLLYVDHDDVEYMGNRPTTGLTASLNNGCTVDVLGKETVSYGALNYGVDWAHVRVTRCTLQVATGQTDPYTGQKPTKDVVYDGWLGYFPRANLGPADGRVDTEATATAIARSNEAELGLRRALDLVSEAYKAPTADNLRALTSAFSADALSWESTEAEHLVSSGLHVADSALYQLDVLSTTRVSLSDAQIKTHEVWTYDERDGQDRRVRCTREESEQSYGLRWLPGGWRVEAITVTTGTIRRADC